MLDALILEVTGGRTCSAAEITVTEDSKLGGRMTEVADGRIDITVDPDYLTLSLQHQSGHILYFARNSDGVMEHLPEAGGE
jgi:hypothetical protein